MTYPFVAAPDHWPRKTPIRAIALHHAEGGGTVGWLTRPDGNSSHYVVEYTGRIVQMVKEDRAAGSINPTLIRLNDDPPFTYLGESITYGATAARAALGAAWSNPNSAVIAVEIEGFAKTGPNAAQRGSLRTLVADIRKRHGSLPTLGHRDFQNYKACPGKLIPWVDYGGHGIPEPDTSSEETDVPGLTLTDIVLEPGWVIVKPTPPGIQAVQVDDPSQRFTLAPGTEKPTIGKARLVGDPLGADTPTESRHIVRMLGGKDRTGAEVELAVILADQVDGPAPVVPETHTITVQYDGQTKAEVQV